ncbi:MAG: sulfite exporter TauE/SafE family protein [Acidimicrobiia bacterium]|nr:sulfite exporter TauE/SafE family protein [Acidimicrobiia bacterium]
MDPLTVVLVGIGALATSALTAVLGFGGGMVLLAILLFFVDPLVAIPLHAAIQVVSNGTRTVIRRHDVEWSIAVPASALMLPAGALAMPLVVRAPEALLQGAIAVTVLLATWVPERTSLELAAPSRRGWLGVSAVIGALNVVVGATGALQPPLFRAATSSRLGFVGTFAATQVAGHAAKIVLFGIAGLAPTRFAPAAVAGIVGVIAGTHLGSRALDRMPEERFRRLYLGAITAVGAYLLIDALV